MVDCCLIASSAAAEAISRVNIAEVDGSRGRAMLAGCMVCMVCRMWAGRGWLFGDGGWNYFSFKNEFFIQWMSFSFKWMSFSFSEWVFHSSEWVFHSSEWVFHSRKYVFISTPLIFRTYVKVPTLSGILQVSARPRHSFVRKIKRRSRVWGKSAPEFATVRPI